MGRGNDSWGIEVGANAIKAVHLTRTGSGAKAKVQMVHHEVIPFKKVLTTPDLNVDEAIQVNLDQLMAAHDLSKSNVVISVPGHMAFARFAKLPPVEPKKIPDIVKFEAVQQIPFPIEQVEWDYQVFQQEDSPDVEVGIFAITKEKVMNYLSNYNAVNLRVDAMTLSPIAVFNAFVYDNAEDPPDEGVIYMDIGTTSTDVIIVEDGGIWLRTLPLGGNTFTEALVKAFKLSFHKAEKLKKEAATSKYARQIFQAMRPVFADLVQELQRSLGYYQSLNRDANLTKLVCVGSTFKLPGLQKFLKQQLQMEVERPDGFKRISVDDKHASEFADIAGNLATAYGCALQGLGLESVSANILPSHIISARMWKAKQPWIAAAAACFVAMAGVAAGTAFQTVKSYDSGVQEAKQLFARVDSRAHQLKQQYDQMDTTSDPRQRIQNLRRVLDSRDVWPKLLEDITHATMALNPDPVELSNRYDLIVQKIPNREDRKRVYIESITSTYVPGGDDESTEGDMDMMGDPMGMQGGYGGMGMDGGYGGMGMDGGYGQGMDGGYGQQGMDGGYGGYGGMGMGGGMGYGMGGPTGELGASYTLDDFFGEGKTRPHFIVTVRGTTPNKNGAQFLESNFIQWFKDHAADDDKPYRFVEDSIVMEEFGPVQVAPKDGAAGPDGMGTGYEGGYGAQAGGYGGQQGGYQGGYQGDAGGYGGMGGGYGAYAGGAGATDLAALLPKRPLADEDRSKDARFTIKFEVELRRPVGEDQAEAEGADPTQDVPTDEPMDAPEAGPTAVLPTETEEQGGAS